MIKIGKNISRKQLELAKKTCFGKIQHKSLLSAKHILDKMNGKDSHLLEIYECPFCDFFHIGHNRIKQNDSKSKTVVGEK